MTAIQALENELQALLKTEALEITHVLNELIHQEQVTGYRSHHHSTFGLQARAMEELGLIKLVSVAYREYELTPKAYVLHYDLKLEGHYRKQEEQK